jgi:UDP-N-acetylglucosamine--N-acetylmuramyl-(pentapeptide) pyrophosphoryl-undecaprenol N-acetylglucosamine transferase
VNNAMRVIISGGGTGGHIYPALALAKQIQEHHQDAQILYIGSTRGLEADIVSKAGYRFESIEISGFKRSLSIDNVKTVFRFIRAVSNSKRIIKDFSPDIVVGTGGYVCGPVVFAADRLGVPTLIHEQNVVPGLTNKFLSRFVSRIAVSFSGSTPYFPQSKVVLTGNPRATEVARADRHKGRMLLEANNTQKVVLVVGGSRGAKAINEAFVTASAELAKKQGLYFVYVTGDAHYNQVRQRLNLDRSGGFAQNISIHSFIYNMPEVLATTDLIINRAGASFLSEITSLGIPSILIPSPYVTNNHQEKNARWLEENGAAKVILESQLTADTLCHAIDEIMGDEAVWKRMKQAALKLGEPAAAEKVYQELYKLLRQ